MKHKGDRVLTTHTGSLPRPAELLGLVYAQAGRVDEQAFASRLEQAVVNVVRRQHAAGVDIVSDGEMSKPSYATYVAERLTGFEAGGRMPMPADLIDFPGYAERLYGDPALSSLSTPACTSAIRYVGADKLERDLSNFRRALVDSPSADAFMTAASPGVISLFLEDRFYKSHDAYLAALADAMREEYEAIHRAGFLLQVDCPDLAMGRHMQFSQSSTREFRHLARAHIEALNHALANIPPERMRIHLCWGNYEGPHHHDVPLRGHHRHRVRGAPRRYLVRSVQPAPRA